MLTANASVPDVRHVDRTSEFRSASLHGGPKVWKRQPHNEETLVAIERFTNQALHIVTRCEALTTGIERYLASVHSLDSLLSLRQPSDAGNAEMKQAAAVRTELAELKSLVKTLTTSFEKEEDTFPFTATLKNHHRAVLEYLSQRVVMVAASFQKAELERLQRTESLQRCQPLPPLQPKLSEGLGPDPGYFHFLSHRWQSALLEHPQSKPIAGGATPPHRAEPQKQHHRKDPSTVDDTAWEDHISDLQDNDDALSHRKENLTLNAQPSIDDLNVTLPEDLGRQLQADCRQLLLQQERHLAEEVPLRFAAVKAILDTFATEVVQQAELCDYIQTTVEEGVENMAGAAQQLAKAKERRSSYRFYLVVLYVGAALVLLVCDFFTSSRWV